MLNDYLGQASIRRIVSKEEVIYMMLVTIKNIGLLMFESLKYIWKHPKLLFMVLISLVLYLPLYYYLVIKESLLSLDWIGLLIRLAVFFVGVPLIYTLVNFVFIELAKQEHIDKRIKLSSALTNAIVVFLKALPLVILWVVFRYLLMALKILFAPPRFGDNEFSSINREVSTSRSGVRSIDVYAVAKWQTGKNIITNLYRRGLHDGFMMIYTGLSVETSYAKAINKALTYYKKEAGIIRTGYDARFFTLLVLVLPAMLTIGGLQYDIALRILFAYLGLVWIYLSIIKQLLITNLYLWMNDFELSNETNLYNVKKPAYLNHASAVYLSKLKNS